MPGIFTLEQRQGWMKVTEAVREKQGFIFCQLWHEGRVAHGRLSDLERWSPSSVPIKEKLPQAGDLDSVSYNIPHAMTSNEVQEVQEEYLTAAQNAIASGFHGIEIHAANGYLPDQFHHSNMNLRTDEYGGTHEKRCHFTIELMRKLCSSIGPKRLGVRLAPFGLFNETRGDDRQYQWTYLCESLSELGLAYIHLIEPRFDEWGTEAEKLNLLRSSDTWQELSLRPYQEAIKPPTKCIVAGGYHPDNCWQGVEKGEHDAVAFGRFFISNPDLVERLKTGQRLYRYDRSRFYGPFEDNEIGYTVHMNREFANETDIGRAQLV